MSSLKKTLLLVVNFGGPRHLEEVESFLCALLTDQDVIRTWMPRPIHRWFFSRVAKKRAHKVSEDYSSIGGKSPIFEETEGVAKEVSKNTGMPFLTFHRYLTSTHSDFLEAIQSIECDEILVFPLFPQFSYATTGSIARWFERHLSAQQIRKMRWIPSYASHPAYIHCFQQRIHECLLSNSIKEEEAILLFSAHGVPKEFILTGDLYERECCLSFEGISHAFPKALCKLSYQSKFGSGEWLEPSTEEACEKLPSWNQGRKQVVFIPLSFTSDHIETLFEVEKLYLPLAEKKGISAVRCPAFNRHPKWIEAILEILQGSSLCQNQLLIR